MIECQSNKGMGGPHGRDMIDFSSPSQYAAKLLLSKSENHPEMCLNLKNSVWNIFTRITDIFFLLRIIIDLLIYYKYNNTVIQSVV